MTLREWLAHAEAQLCTGPHPDRARRDAETLLLHLIGKNKAWLMMHAEDDFAGCTAIRYASLLERRRKGEPIQYITGGTEFYGLPFLVTPDVLIPRPETEFLVEKALELAAAFEHPRIIDIATGSGAIAIALAHRLSTPIAAKDLAEKITEARFAAEDRRRGFLAEGTGFSPYIHTAQRTGALAPEGLSSANPSGMHAQITATDISASALSLAEENAKRNGVAIRFLQGDLLAPVAGEQFDIIVSNPPYVANSDRDSLSVEVHDHEPALALFAGNDGLEIYRRLIPQAFSALTPGGFIALEIGHGQQPAIHTLLEDVGFGDIQFTPDLQGTPRVAVARRP